MTAAGASARVNILAHPITHRGSIINALSIFTGVTIRCVCVSAVREACTILQYIS